MSAKPQIKSSRKLNQRSGLEVLDEVRTTGSNAVKGTTSEFKNIGRDMFDQLMRRYESPDSFEGEAYPSKAEQKPQKKEFKLFNSTEHYEIRTKQQEIDALLKQIQQEMKALKESDSSLLNEVSDIQKLSLEEMPNKPGIYHIRFLEIVLSILRTVRQKVGESNTWLEAMMSKRKKRGSLFMSLSKKKGTQYSLSTEISTARAVQ